MENRIIIIGAGGHGLVVANIAKLCGFSKIEFLDDNIYKEYPYKIVGKIKDYKKFICNRVFFVAIGNNNARKTISEELNNNGAKIINLIHPSAVVDENVVINDGVVIMANTVITSFSIIGYGCIINTACTVDHNTVLEEFVHLSPGCHLAGNVKVGSLTWIGIGSSIINNISIANNCIIGAGSVVIRNIYEKGTYIGVPTKKI